MRQLLNFIYRYRAFGVFLLLELACFWMIVNKNSYQQAAFLSSSSKVVGNAFQFKSSITDYLSLQRVNDELVAENALLQEQLQTLGADEYRIEAIVPPSGSPVAFTPAKVVNNSILFSDNYLTIDQGRAQGVMPGMGVVGPSGLVGQVKASSDNFATVYSLLHAETMVSAEIQKNQVLATVKWDGRDPRTANLLYVSKYVPVSIGDTIVTSGFNAVFPENTLIGTIWRIENTPVDAYQNIRVRLSTDFSRIKYVYVVKHRHKAEIDSLQNLE